jgi:membrane protease YdiL (CAAX protease family)
MTEESKPWGRAATFALAVLALLIGQFVALFALTFWYGQGLGHLPDFSGDGLAITLVITVSTPVQVGLLALFATRTGASAADYLGLKWPSRGEFLFGLAATVTLIVVANLVSWLLGHNLVTPFQTDIYTTASAAGWLLWLLIAVIILTPIGEEILFRGFLFRGWLRNPGDARAVIVATALLWAIIHVQYDWFVIAQIFAFGLLLGWLRWASGSVILTILLHALINAEGMLETVLSQKWFG